MTSGLKVIGVGMWRTATYSLKLALEELTGEKCLHMSELYPPRYAYKASPQYRQTEKWLKVIKGVQEPFWLELFQGYGNTTDWPALMFWQELAEFYPDAKILLSSRDPESWWQSISQTVLAVGRREKSDSPWDQMVKELFDRDFIGVNPTKQQAIKYFEDHNAQVRKAIPKDRLIDWQIGDDWAPLCEALQVPVPNKPFPRTNSTAEFRQGNRLS